MVDFPNNPSDGDIHTEEGTTWTYRNPPGAWSIGLSSTTERTIITSGLPSASWQIWGDVLIQWGTADTVSGVAPVVFPKAFKVAPSITVTPVQGTGDATASVENVAFDRFDTYTRNTGGGAIDVDVLWIAIGEATDADKMPKTVINYANAGGGSGGATVTIGPAFPLTPVPGALHYLTDPIVGLYIYYDDGTSGQWVQTNGAAAIDSGTDTSEDVSYDTTDAGSVPANSFSQSWRITDTFLEVWGYYHDDNFVSGTVDIATLKTFARQPTVMLSAQTAGPTVNLAGTTVSNLRINTGNRTSFFYRAFGEWDGVS